MAAARFDDEKRDHCQDTNDPGQDNGWRAAALGYEGKWAIHPSQIALANEIFTPPAAELERARRILDALDQAAREGRGAAQLDGRMIDAASARMARNIVAIASTIAARERVAPPLAATRV